MVLRETMLNVSSAGHVAYNCVFVYTISYFVHCPPFYFCRQITIIILSLFIWQPSSLIVVVHVVCCAVVFNTNTASAFSIFKQINGVIIEGSRTRVV